MDLIEESNNAVNLVKQGQYKKAEKIYKNLLKEYPDNALLSTLLGYMYLEIKEYEKAEIIFQKAYSLSDDIKILKGLINAKYNSNNHTNIIPLYEKILDLEPTAEYYKQFTDILSGLICAGNSSVISIGNKYFPDAYEKYPFEVKILSNYALFALYSGRYTKSEQLCRQAIRINPKSADAWMVQGIIYESLYNDELKAQECHKKSIKYGLKYFGYGNLAVSYQKTGNYRQSNYYFNKALKLTDNQNDKNSIYCIQAYNYLAQRKFKEGYKLYTKQCENQLFYTLKNKWDGKPHKDKTLFVLHNLCFGDHIFHARYFPLLKKMFKKVIVQTYKVHVELFSNSFEGIDFVYKKEIPEYDYFVPMTHLPYYMLKDFSNIPFSGGYLKSDKSDIKSDKLKVGLCWETGHTDIRNSIHRNVNIQEFEVLFKEDYDFYSFQKDAAMDYSEYNIIDLNDKLDTFSDTAKYLSSMDVVVSVDTAVANLAGALGIKTCLLLPYYSEWRWFDNTEKTEWYKSVKIYKQTEKHTWQNEIKRIIDDLRKF